MLYDLRTYTVYPGKLGEYIAIYKAEALPVQLETLERLVGYFTTEVGALNQAIHIWAYENSADRDSRREKMFADVRFKMAAAKLYPLIQTQSNVLMLPTEFSPLM